jgi:hypothetical protein
MKLKIAQRKAQKRKEEEKRREAANPCGGPTFTCQAIVTNPAGVTPAALQSQVVDDDFTGFGPEDPPTVNGQRFTPAYGGMQRGVAILELLMMGGEFLHYSTPLYSKTTGSNAQGVIPVVHNNASGLNVIPGVGVYNNTGMNLLVGGVSVNGNYLITSGAMIPDDSLGAVQFADSPVMLTTNISVVINFQAVQSNGTMFGFGQITYDGPNYVPFIGPLPPP